MNMHHLCGEEHQPDTAATFPSSTFFYVLSTLPQCLIVYLYVKVLDDPVKYE